MNYNGKSKVRASIKCIQGMHFRQPLNLQKDFVPKRDGWRAKLMAQLVYDHPEMLKDELEELFAKIAERYKIRKLN